ncbi:alpha/beta hydrolase family protein [Nubsella zeaxanthinifaciens]|uniref:alpha/beta hydrolase family protein n=1 Tax=Nubsella zeaxanthinifaciens TaxID=392412 RepID=UPI003D00455F
MYRFLGATLLVFLGLQLHAQKQYQVMDWKTDVSLNTYLVQQMKSQYQLRNLKLTKALTSKNTAIAYQNGVKAKAESLFKNLPPKAVLNAKVTGIIQQNGYRIEKVVYQSFQNHHVTANLYMPTGKGPFAAVLLFCGHEDTSKATESYQKTAQLLVKNGFVVLVIDPISQSERVQLTDENGKSLTRGSTTEHTLLNLQSNLLGTSVAAYELLDNECGLDYLLTRKEVDPNKIACVGNSGGAIQAIYFAAIDERVKAIVPCSYLSSRENTLATSGAADGCAQIPNEGLLQLEMSDYLIAAAPKPILVLAGRYDFIDYNGTEQSVADLKKFYAKLGVANRISFFTYDDGHGISKPKREKAVQWLRKWFYNDDRKIVEPELTALSDVELFSSEKGKVGLSYPNEVAVQQLNLQRFNSYAQKRREFSSVPIDLKLKRIEKLLNIGSLNKKIEVEEVGQVGKGKLNFSKMILRKDGEPPMPVLLYGPEKPVKKVVIFVSDAGKGKLADSLSLFDNYLSDQSTAIIVADLRGTGETADKAALNDPKYFSDDYRNAMFALHIGKPLLGQRTADMLTLFDFSANLNKTDVAEVTVISFGNVGLAALHASLFNNTVNQMELHHCIQSFKEVFENPLGKNRYGLVVDGIAQYYDIPDMLQWQQNKLIKFY